MRLAFATLQLALDSLTNESGAAIGSDHGVNLVDRLLRQSDRHPDMVERRSSHGARDSFLGCG